MCFPLSVYHPSRKKKNLKRSFVRSCIKIISRFVPALCMEISMDLPVAWYNFRIINSSFDLVVYMAEISMDFLSDIPVVRL